MNAKKYLASILTASLLIGFQVKAEDTKKDEEALKNIEKIVKTEAKNEGVSTESWYSSNEKVVLGVAGAAVVGGGIAAAYFGGKYVAKNAPVKAFENKVAKVLKDFADKPENLQKRITDGNTTIATIDADIKKLDATKDQKKIEELNKRKNVINAANAETQAIIAAQTDAAKKAEFFENLSKAEITKVEKTYTASFKTVITEALAPKPVTTKAAPKEKKAEPAKVEAPKAEAKKDEKK